MEVSVRKIRVKCELRFLLDFSKIPAVEFQLSRLMVCRENHFFAVANTKESRKDEKYRCFLRNRDDDLFVAASITPECNTLKRNWERSWKTPNNTRSLNRIKATGTNEFIRLLIVFHFHPLSSQSWNCRTRLQTTSKLYRGLINTANLDGIDFQSNWCYLTNEDLY